MDGDGWFPEDIVYLKLREYAGKNNEESKLEKLVDKLDSEFNKIGKDFVSKNILFLVD